MRVNEAACRERRALCTSGAAGMEPRLVSNKGSNVCPGQARACGALVPAAPKAFELCLSTNESFISEHTLAQGETLTSPQI